MNFPSIDIQGSILSSDLFGKIRSEQANFQQGKDFSPGLTTAKLKDEISLAWQDAKGQWTIFQNKLKRLEPGESGSTETRSFWILPLLSNLGYDFQYLKSAEELNGKSFWINNRDNNIGGFPLFIAGCHESLDRRSENKTLRVSPHALVQEYLNYSEHLYGLVTNGKFLRLLRDASRLTRLSYLEFNLEKIMEEDLYSDFVILYRLLHVSRMPQQQDGGAESIIEKYHQEGLEAGATIRSKLGDAVKESILALTKGFVNHLENEKLRQAIANGLFEPDEFYRQQLRIVYRLLFLFVIEERNLVYSESKDPDIRRFSQIYYRYFSLQRLRKLARHLPPPDSSRHYDLWMGMINTFALFEDPQIGAKMGIMALQGDLFNYDAITDHGYDLHQCRLGNDILLCVIKALGYFENERKLLVPVNYGGLDVEEFGSVYEGLLELKLKIEPVPGIELYSCVFDKSSERSSSGSHYTPEELVQPLIKHSLDYIIEDRLKTSPLHASGAKQTISEIQSIQKQQLLSIRVCDVACGSGHILLSAARKIAMTLARVETGEEQPNPKAIRQAMREVIRNCIYGVDKNPLAVELCKVAFWLESYNPGEPLGFLDHHIKCGDSIVGLAHREELENGIPDEAFKTLPGDEKEIAQTFAKTNRNERREREDKQKAQQLKTSFETSIKGEVNEAMAEYNTFNRLPETTPKEIELKAKAYHRFMGGKGYSFLKAMADAQVAQFFIPKTSANKDVLLTDADFRMMLTGYLGWQGRKTGKATSVSFANRFFHWFLEFPEVMNEGGFDCILGNPPYLGGLRISTNYGDSYLHFLKSSYVPNSTTTDLVAYFLRRTYILTGQNGFISIITTNTICQGDTRLASFDVLYTQGAKINFAMSSVKWPGVANLNVSLFSIFKGKWVLEYFLNGKKVNFISQYISDEGTQIEPNIILNNKEKVYNGSYYLGDGFVINEQERRMFIDQSKKNEEVIFELLIGNDVNESFNHTPSSYIINFFDWPLIKASEYIGPFLRIEKLVKPFRETNKRSVYREKWWMYGERRVGLYESINKQENCFVITATTKYLNLVRQKTDKIFAKSLYVFAIEKYSEFLILQSNIHDLWARKFSSTLGDTLSYTPSTCFDTFPFPLNVSMDQENVHEVVGKAFHEYRRQLMLSLRLGLTKTYNAFHAREITTFLPSSASLSGLDKKAIEKQYGKEVWNLWNHLQRTPDTCTFEEAVAGIVKLRELHVGMDQAVLDAYGWQDVQLRHYFYGVDYLPENDRVRYTIHPEACKEILKRLLELNHKIHEEEVKKGLWDKKKTAGKEYKKVTDTGHIVEVPEEGYGQGRLF
jgi:hypothetical protein